MAILKVLTAPDPILKKRSLPIDSVDDSIRKIMDDMLETMYKKRVLVLLQTKLAF